MILDTLKFIITHPLNSDRKVAAIIDWFCWQIGSRLLPGAVEVPFVNDAVLIAEHGMTGATGNIYGGLAEFEDMSFLLHFLQPKDLFVDVGANIGSYTLLASKVLGVKSIAIEALPVTYAKLMRNIRVNDIVDRVDALNCGLGAKEGEIYFTSDLDTMNHAISDLDSRIEKNICVVPVKKMDEILNGKVPSLIKIDVEGYETPVIQGAMKTLQDSRQETVIMELNGCGARYDFNDLALHAEMRNMGYCAVAYCPIKRKLERLDQPNNVGNTIYIKEKKIDSIRLKLMQAKPFFVKDRHV